MTARTTPFQDLPTPDGPAGTAPGRAAAAAPSPPAARGTDPAHEGPRFGDLVRAERLKLRRSRALQAVTLGAALLPVALNVGLRAAQDLELGGSAHLASVVAAVGAAAYLVSVIVGASAGAADHGAGTFRDVAASGLDRRRLYAARVAGATSWWLPRAALGLLLGAATVVVLTGGQEPTAWGEVAPDAALVLGGAALTTVLGVALGTASGSRGATVAAVLGWDMVAVPLLTAATALGSWRLLAGPQQAWARLGGDVLPEAPVAWAVASLVLWAVVPMAVGLRRLVTAEA